MDSSYEQQMIREKVVASLPSPSSSPSHEFSFTISFSSSSATDDSTALPPDKASKTLPPFAIDLSPADDIFFHGHLLPLHLLSHLPVSPCSSTNSQDSFTLPIKTLLEDNNHHHYQEPYKYITNSISNNLNNNNSTSTSTTTSFRQYDQTNNSSETRPRTKSKSFSLFGLAKRRKGFEVGELENSDHGKESKRKMGLDVSNVLKRYARMVRPLLFFGGRKENMQLHRQGYSFPGNLSLRNKDSRGINRRGRDLFSAPASMRTSPTNSGLLLATAGGGAPYSSSDSTMEELQSAIQAAIAHCKNSISKEDRIKC